MPFKVISVAGHWCSTHLHYINVPQHWSPWMTYWYLLEVCTTSMCSNIDHLEWHLNVYWRCVLRQCAATLKHLEWDHDVYWRCVLRKCAVTLITLIDTLMFNGGGYYINVQQHWSPWMTYWCLFEVCTTSMCSVSIKVISVTAHWRSTHLQ
jgi:hypothetical protein